VGVTSGSEPRPAPPVLHAEGLVRRYGGRDVVRIDALEVQPGGVLAILGPNGAGKSTLFRLLLLLEAPDAGRIAFRGRAVGPGDRQAMLGMAGVFQRPFLFSGTVAANVGFGLAARGVPAAERSARTAEALDWLGIASLAGAPVATLSGGEAQRVALARALVLRPELLLLDEPTANLDVTVRRRFLLDLERVVRTRAGAALLITHDASEAFALADRVAVMEDGRITQVGTPDELVLAPASPFAAALTGAELLVDGVVRGIEEGLLDVEIGRGARLLTTGAGGEAGFAEGQRVHIAYRPEDIVLSAPGEASVTSARNHLRLRIAAVAPAGALVRVRLEGDAPLVALLTRGSAERLGLVTGLAVEGHLKATALRSYPSG
jgi:molybdate transport system ATP-binding protein